MFFFMKKQGWSTLELDPLNPFELELYYYMAVSAYKAEKGVK